jgi:broad specificity phosphatase PhoE
MADGDLEPVKRSLDFNGLAQTTNLRCPEFEFPRARPTRFEGVTFAFGGQRREIRTASEVRGGIEALPAGDVIIVAHAGTIRAALALALELPPERALRFVIDPRSLTRLDRLDNAWRVVAVNRG